MPDVMSHVAQPVIHPRTMGWPGTVALAMGGSNQSLFLVGALVAAQGSAAVPLLVVGLILAWLALPGWTELVLMWPNRVGGIAATCAEAFRPYSPVLANLTGVAYWWGWVPTCGLTALLSGSALHEWYLPGVPVTVLAIGIIVALTVVNLLGVKWAVRVAVPVACAAAALALASVLVPVVAGTVDWHRAASFHLALPFHGFFGALTSAMAGLYLIGFAAPAFEAAACHVGETRDPERNVPKAMYRSAALSGLYFLIVPVVWLGVLGQSGLGGPLMHTLGPAFAPLLGGAAKAAAIWFIVFNMLHGTLQPLAGASRTLSQLAEDGLLPRSLARRNRFDCPWLATLATAGFAVVLLQSGDPPWIIAAANFCYLIGIGLPSVAVWLLRRHEPHMRRPYRAPRFTVGLGLAAATAWLVATFLGLEQFGLPTVLASLAMAYSGSVLYAWRRWGDHRAAGKAPSAFWRSLHVKLTGAMLAVMALDGTGYLLAVAHVSGQPALIAALKDIFVAVAILSVAVGLVLPGMIAHGVAQVSQAARQLAAGTLVELTRSLRALARGDLEAAHARPDVSLVKIRSADEVGEMADSFNAMQGAVKGAALALDEARDGLLATRGALQRSHDQQATVAELGALAVRHPSLDELMAAALHAACRALRADAASVLALDPAGAGMHLRAALGPGAPACLAAATASVPLTAQGHPFGALTVLATAARPVSGDELDVLRTIAGLLTGALERDRIETEIRHQALHDPLTGLPNRTLFADRLALALAHGERQRRCTAVLFLDLDQFKLINDSLGHAVGDELLGLLAARLLGVLRPGDTLARFGGDEFVTICDDLADPAEAELIARRLLSSLAVPFVLAGSDHAISASIGISVAEGTRRDPEDLMREADAAMYRAKERGRNRSELYDEVMRARALDRLRVESELRRALVADELRLHYQPIVATASRAVTGVEALVRWEHPQRGLLAPAEFIPVAEETGVIVALGEWVLLEACRQGAAWHAARPDHPPAAIAVNLSTRQIAHPAIVDVVRGALAVTGIDPTALHLEITESVLMEDPVQSAETLGRLKALGVALVLDDFGTGYSSLSYLRSFPIDQLKIDRQFVRELDTSGADATIVQAVLRMADGLGIEAVAEGVENREQHHLLVELGCRLAQGYHYARPQPADAAEALLDLRLPVGLTPPARRRSAPV
jgi:diguanylate cyclase (GGDEF)-like protein